MLGKRFLKKFLLALMSFSFSLLTASETIPVYGEIEKFSLIDQNSNVVTDNDLKNKITVLSFIFTRCATICPVMMGNFQSLYKLIRNFKEVQLIAITGDPEYDRPFILKEFAKNLQAGERWLFLTGKPEVIYKLSSKSLKLGLKKATVEELQEGSDIIIHSSKFVLIDYDGKIRGYFDGTDRKSVKEVYKSIIKLLPHINKFFLLSRVNTLLNGISAMLLLFGFYFIKLKKTAFHRIFMLSAFSTSVLFFASYLVYHFKVGSVRFLEEGIIKGIYLVILSTHSVFAIIIVPLILITLYLAITEQFSRHKNIAKITLPLWLYVNISGIIVYFLLYV